MKLDQAIKKRRKLKQITQKDLAARCGLSGAYISMIETGKKKPMLCVLKSIAHEIQIPTAFLLLLSTDIDEIPEADREYFDDSLEEMKSLILDVFYNEL